MSYAQPLSQANPGCFIFLLDQSGSMSSPWGGTGTREQQVADIINKFLQELCLICDSGGKVKDRAYISVIGYGASVGSAFSGALSGKMNVKLSEIDSNPIEIQKRKIPDGAGGILEIMFPVWIKPSSNGGTPMKEAFTMALDIVGDWVVNHPNSYPPIVINITDGEYGNSPDAEVLDIKSKSTSDGSSLVFNVHIENNDQISFCPANDAGLNGYAKALFDFSSELPGSMVVMAIDKGNPGVSQGSKGFVFNGDFVSLVTFLQFASPLQPR